MIPIDERETNSEEREQIRILLQHPGWTLLVNKVFRRKADSLRRRMSTHQYENLADVKADQAFIQCLEGISTMIENTLAEDEVMAKRRAEEARRQYSREQAKREGRPRGGASY